MKTLPFATLLFCIVPVIAFAQGATIKATATMHPDGTRSTTVTDPDKRTTEETWLDASGKTLRRIVYPLDERDMPAGANVFDKNGKLSYKSTYTRDSADRIGDETIYSANGQMLRRRVYQYDARNKITGVEEYDAKGTLIPRAVEKTSPARPDKKKKR